MNVHDRLWRELGRKLRRGDGAAAREHLDAGFPIYYAEDDTPPGLLVKMWPNGRKELVRFDEAGDVVVRTL